MRHHLQIGVQVGWIFSLISLSSDFATEVVAQPVGVKTCGACHPKQLRDWRSGPHARSHLSLAAHQRRDPHCRACHDDAGVSDQLKRAFRFTGNSLSSAEVPAGVDCESCHGLGGDILGPQGTHRAPTQPSIRPTISHDTQSKRLPICLRCHQLDPITQSISHKRRQGAFQHGSYGVTRAKMTKTSKHPSAEATRSTSP